MKPIIYKTRPRINGKVNFVDAYTSAIPELFFIQNPKIKKGTVEAKDKLQKFLLKTKFPERWIYFQEDNILVRSLDEKNYFKLRTSRNKNLISHQEQTQFRNLSVGIAGLSVGSCILSSIVISGGPKQIKIADFDTLEITNLNRIRAKLKDIGKNKIQIAAKEIWELDPDAELGLYEHGITEQNLKEFLAGKPKLNIFIDEMDSIPLKIQSRFLCKKLKIPVIMATDNGDSVILDVERYDLEPKREIFHGLLGKINPENLKNLTYNEWLSLATKIVGGEYLTTNMQESLLQIGKKLPAVPQLGAIASVAGAATCLVLRRIASKKNMPSGRYIISLEEKIIPNYFSKFNIKQRNKTTNKFKLNFGKKI